MDVKSGEFVWLLILRNSPCFNVIKLYKYQQALHLKHSINTYHVYHAHQRWPEAELEIIDDAGHSAKEVGIVSALVKAADKYKDL